MGRYKKITKKKEAALEPLAITEEEALHWLSDSATQLMLGVGGIILLVALFYGVGYYQQVSLSDSRSDLYRAASVAPASGATKAQADEAVEKLRAFIAAGGADAVVASAHMELAALLARSGKAEETVAEYDQVMALAEPGSAMYEVALAGKAKGLVRAENYAGSVAALEKIASSTSPYALKREALTTLLFVHAMAGETQKGLDALNRLKNAPGAAADKAYLDELGRRIEGGELVVASASAHAGASTDLAEKLQGENP